MTTRVPQCKCYTETRNCGGVPKRFRYLPAWDQNPCPAHGKNER